MKPDKSDFIMWLIGIGAILCMPFQLIYEVGKKIYYCMPWKLAEVRIRNKRIHELEEKLGLDKRDDEALYYDPFYYKNRDNDRSDYLNDLEYKVARNYKSPDFIKVINRNIGLTGWGGGKEPYREYGLAILVNKRYYKMSEGEGEIQHQRDAFGKSEYKEKYHAPLDPFFFMNDYRIFETLSECGNYNDYYYINIGGKFTRFEATTNKGIDNFIEDFKRKYAK